MRLEAAASALHLSHNYLLNRNQEVTRVTGLTLVWPVIRCLSSYFLTRTLDEFLVIWGFSTTSRNLFSLFSCPDQRCSWWNSWSGSSAFLETASSSTDSSPSHAPIKSIWFLLWASRVLLFLTASSSLSCACRKPGSFPARFSTFFLLCVEALKRDAPPSDSGSSAPAVWRPPKGAGKQTTDCSLGIWKVSQMVSERYVPTPH